MRTRPGMSGDGGGVAHAPDHRALDQIFPVARAVGGDGAQLGEALGALLRIALLQQLLVADRLRLDEFDVGGAPLAYVFVEQTVLRLALPYRAELLRQVESAVQRAVEAEGAQRIVQMRGVADQPHAAS